MKKVLTILGTIGKIITMIFICAIVISIVIFTIVIFSKDKNICASFMGIGIFLVLVYVFKFVLFNKTCLLIATTIWGILLGYEGILLGYKKYQEPTLFYRCMILQSNGKNCNAKGECYRPIYENEHCDCLIENPAIVGYEKLSDVSSQELYNMKFGNKCESTFSCLELSKNDDIKYFGKLLKDMDYEYIQTCFENKLSHYSWKKISEDELETIILDAMDECSNEETDDENFNRLYETEN